MHFSPPSSVFFFSCSSILFLVSFLRFFFALGFL